MDEEREMAKRGVCALACFFGVVLLAAAMAAGGETMEPVKTEDGLFELTVMELHDNHGVTEVAGKIANNSGRDYKSALFTLIAYRPDGGEAARREVKIEGLANGCFRVFRVDVNANILAIGKFGIAFNSGE